MREHKSYSVWDRDTGPLSAPSYAANSHQRAVTLWAEEYAEDHGDWQGMSVWAIDDDDWDISADEDIAAWSADMYLKATHFKVSCRSEVTTELFVTAEATPPEDP